MAVANPDWEGPLLLHPKATLIRTNFGALLRDPTSGKYQALSQSDALGLALCGGKYRLSDIASAMAELYHIASESVEAELRSLYAKHLERGLIFALPAPLPAPLYDHRPFVFRPEDNPRAIHPSTLPSLALQLTERCVLGCAYCYAYPEPDTQDSGLHMPAETALRVLTQGRELGASEVLFGGGEPLIHPDVVAIIERAVRLGYTSIQLSTKATTVTPDLAAALRRVGLGRIQVSLDSWRADEVDRLLGRPGAFSRALGGLVAMLRAGFAVHIRATITKLNADNFPELVRALARLGVTSFRAGVMVPVGRGSQSLLPTSEQVENLERELETIRHEMPRLALSALGGMVLNQCGGGRLDFFVLADGRVLPCDLISTIATEREVLGNVEEESLADIWSGERVRAFRTPRVSHPTCLDCKVLALCTGGCRVRAYMTTGDMNQPDPLCPKVYPERGSDGVGGWTPAEDGGCA